MNRFLQATLALISLGLSMCSPSPDMEAPPNTPALLTREGNTIILSYAGVEIMSLTTDLSPDAFTVKELKEEPDGKVSHLFTVSTPDGRPMNISGIIRAGKESFTCEADRRIEGTQVVRHTFGLSHSLLNRAVYDRRSDWLLSADQSYTSASLRIMPEVTDSTGITYEVRMTGNEVTFRFRPHYYQRHRGLTYYEPHTPNASLTMLCLHQGSPLRRTLQLML